MIDLGEVGDWFPDEEKEKSDSLQQGLPECQKHRGIPQTGKGKRKDWIGPRIAAHPPISGYGPIERNQIEEGTIILHAKACGFF